MHEEQCIRCQGQRTFIFEVCHGKKQVLKEMVTEKCEECNGTGKGYEYE